MVEEGLGRKRSGLSETLSQHLARGAGERNENIIHSSVRPSGIPSKNEVLPTSFHLLDCLHKYMKNIPKKLHVQYRLPRDVHDVRNT
jgi:hypothetical protein